MNEDKKYHPEHEKIKVRCPCCGKLMRGWTKDRDWRTYWIAHIVPNKKNPCWATEEQMVKIKKEWERKYDRAEHDKDPGSDHH